MGPSAADTLGAGAAGPEERRTWQVRRSLNVRRACLSRSGGVLPYPSLRWRRRSGNRRVNGRQDALSASCVACATFSLVCSDLGNHQTMPRLIAPVIPRRTSPDLALQQRPSTPTLCPQQFQETAMQPRPLGNGVAPFERNASCRHHAMSPRRATSSHRTAYQLPRPQLRG